MKMLRDMRISRKLATITAIATAAAVMLMSAAFIAYDYSSSRREALEELEIVGSIAAGNSTAAVAFGDAHTAAEVLNTLREHPEIESACTYDADRRLLADYHGSQEGGCPQTIPSQRVTLVPGGAAFAQVIKVNDVTAGSVYVQSNLSRMKARRSRFAVITGAFLVLALLTGALLGMVLQRWVVKPVTALASVIDKVSRSRDYSLRASADSNDEVGKLVAGFNSMLTEIESTQARLKEQALNDELTGLPNRRLFADRLSQALAGAARHQGCVAVIYMDLDGFKLVNDTLGHSAGDLLLRQVAERLGKRVRSSDTFARIGGDEFTVIATSVRSQKDVAVMADALLTEFVRPFVVDEHELVLTASIGISMYPADAGEPERLVQQADTAMYVAKSTGRNKAMFFQPEFGDAVRERLELEHQLRQALERGELFPYYQPEFDLVTHRLVRFESLARWQHPTLGLIPPVKFIPIAEESGLIVPIGNFMLELACKDAARWQLQSETPVGVAVNISTIHFLQSNFVDTVARILQKTGLDPKLLQLELTESVLLPGNRDCLDRLTRLQALGITMAVDDFGTGYSSLSYLPALPFNSLKIDRTFLLQVLSSENPRATLRPVVELAHNLHMNVIIEGVETAEQLAFVRELECNEVQGFLMGRPTPHPDQYLKGTAKSHALSGGVQPEPVSSKG